MNASLHLPFRFPFRFRILPAMLLLGGFFAAPLAAHAVDFKVDPGTGLGSGLPKAGSSGESGKRANASGSSEQDERRATEITASEETSFDEKARIATFIGDVKVKDTEFTLTCEKLVAHLHKTVRKEAAEGQEATDEGGGLERAVAQGNVLIVQEKVDAKGEVTRYVGRAARAEYVAATGEVTLTGWPQIQQGINNQVATEEGTVMILNRNGRLRTIGPSKTEIKESSAPMKPAKNGR